MQTILVVDDEEVVRSVVRDMLESDGYTILDTGDPQHALRVARDQPVHLLLSDVVMPLMKGPELAAKLLAMSLPVDQGPVHVGVSDVGGGDVRAGLHQQAVQHAEPERQGPPRADAVLAVRPPVPTGLGSRHCRSLKRWILPVAVLGSSGTNSIHRGYL